ncbi:MAG: beta-ketoacyl-[acyl-carrier-protein] synthase family protein [Pirellulales bacterium]|nr:beta-ketoacyl-[acyl-carrier-protein] synthase family protein [Pirellulales bacterium]
MQASQSGKQNRRVVITGMGVVSPLGSDLEAIWTALVEGRSGVGPLTCLPAEALPIDCAAEASGFSGSIDDFGPLEAGQKKLIRKGLKVMCRESQMGVAVAQLALSHAGLTPGTFDPTRAGIYYGTDYMLSPPDDFIDGVGQVIENHGHFELTWWPEEGMSRMTPLWLLKYLPNMPASHIAIYNDFRGPNNSITLREAAGNLAIGEAFRIVAEGRADIMLAGATGTRLHAMKTIHAAQQCELATHEGDPATACRPFDLNRTGEVLGEGAGAIVLESLDSAQARGAKIFAEVSGRASSIVQGPDRVARRGQALANVLRLVLGDAGVAADDLGHVHAHGLSTRSGDAEEASAIQSVLGGQGKPVPVVAAKSHLGNLGAGGGVVELITSVLALGHDRLFPVLNYTTPDPECPVAAVQDNATTPGDSFVNLSVTPQGQASAVLVRRSA